MAKTDVETTETVPVHQWTDADGYVQIVKCVNYDMTSYNGFVWPTSGPVCPDKWSRETDCNSGGLFGWPWGVGIADGKNLGGKWLIFRAKPENIIFVGPCKVKAVPSEDGELPEVVFCGEMADAMKFTMAGRVKWVQHNSSGSASATGDRGSASATGYSGSASATGSSGSASATGSSGSASATGDRGSASATGYRGSASATGDRGSASATGDRGSASATGYSGSASADAEGTFAFAGYRAKAKDGSAFVIRWWDEDADKFRFAFAVAGEEGIEADKWYVVRNGKLGLE